ncbi:MAG TPA: anaerobic ribonucleoside-triphosphate reductase activating protein [Deltaproteobacteria bacterium]|jgi:pyruvate formate lyase activating enzyme|nr:anaerobic ribonucleoside-triphosphate reductase activating protein [Deltaproteobacteria bacterium]OQC29143.1 MAG: Pyruvate formate-lyase 1-activating enzyme [Deltaproteobacteria bacterium ADurb.Bin072]HRW80983.1 anaerobic ribonucleoside-triphosphate reductase activating protein [Desulfomonilia bacterium]NMD41533.1 anaerobic ribonucleoside-triphosphate reductase activating protein [Deltaproteobacteria bacterium]HNQ84403.1 anaerobic ribonucleoside-triphosphate reductase activating protein [Del
MKAAYLQKTSFIDYPGRISAVVFTQGCNFRCPYCHNPELVVPERYCGTIRIEDIFSFLEKRRGKLDAVVITGGEPTLQADLVPFMQRIRSMGFLVKLDTNGSRPQVLSEVIAQGLPDYVAMDVKAPWDKYAFVAGSPVDITDIGASVELIMGSGIPYEFRTTLVRSLLDPDDVMGIGRAIRGASLYVLQRFAASKHVESSYTDMAPMTDDQIATLVRDLGPLVERCITR